MYDDAGTGVSCQRPAEPPLDPRRLRRHVGRAALAPPHRSPRRMRIPWRVHSCVATKPGRTSGLCVFSSPLAPSAGSALRSAPPPPPLPPLPPPPLAASPLPAPASPPPSDGDTSANKSTSEASSAALAASSAALAARGCLGVGFLGGATRITVSGTASHGALKRHCPVLLEWAFFKHVNVCLSSCVWLSAITAAASMASTSSHAGERGSCLTRP